MRTLELLAPARNLECGIAAIDHGADAVYIGAGQFGARAAAGNTTSDIRQLCQYAHRFMAKVYVTVNTIVYDNELDEVRSMLAQLFDAGIDAILIQDMALVAMADELNDSLGTHVAIHASTQTDNRTAAKVAWMRDAGMARVVLARELSAGEIADIHRKVPEVELEAFVHGALCVSYSGLCYASQHCFGRSANRGMCAQFCRLKFSLTDADGQMLGNRYWLSLRDMCRISHLQEMADAGVTSFKIEGRLKDANYVKNVVAAYNDVLQQIADNSGGKYCRSSLGRVKLAFKPDLRKTFNRGYTPYLIDGNAGGMASPDTPKALGQYVGRVKEVRRNFFTVAGTIPIANGDGLCFFDGSMQLHGFRANRVEGNKVFPQVMPQQLRPNTGLYRNADVEMERQLARKSAERKIPVNLTLGTDDETLRLKAEVACCDITAQVQVSISLEQANQPQEENMVRQLSRLGGTAYEAAKVDAAAVAHLFVPSSVLASLRRDLVEALDKEIMLRAETPCQALPNANCNEKSTDNIHASENPFQKEYQQYNYLYNVANTHAKDFYSGRGVEVGDMAFELGGKDRRGQKPPLLMQCRHCIRRMLGFCTRENSHQAPWREPLMLSLPDGKNFMLKFDCKQCQMNVYAKK